MLTRKLTAIIEDFLANPRTANRTLVVQVVDTPARIRCDACGAILIHRALADGELDTPCPNRRCPRHVDRRTVRVLCVKGG